jgi:hypothetical protein
MGDGFPIPNYFSRVLATIRIPHPSILLWPHIRYFHEYKFDLPSFETGCPCQRQFREHLSTGLLEETIIALA